jgi:hypothetical protein
VIVRSGLGCAAWLTRESADKLANRFPMLLALHFIETAHDIEQHTLAGKPLTLDHLEALEEVLNRSIRPTRELI